MSISLIEGCFERITSTFVKYLFPLAVEGTLRGNARLQARLLFNHFNNDEEMSKAFNYIAAFLDRSADNEVGEITTIHFGKIITTITTMVKYYNQVGGAIPILTELALLGDLLSEEIGVRISQYPLTSKSLIELQQIARQYATIQRDEASLTEFVPVRAFVKLALREPTGLSKFEQNHIEEMLKNSQSVSSPVMDCDRSNIDSQSAYQLMEGPYAGVIGFFSYLRSMTYFYSYDPTLLQYIITLPIKAKMVSKKL